MKTTLKVLMCGLVAGSCVAGPALAQQQGQRRGGADQTERGAEQRAARMAEAFKAMDTDGKDGVSLAEWVAGDKKRMAEMKERMGDRYDEARFANRPKPEETFKLMDKDGDKKLTKEEFEAFRATRRQRGGGPAGLSGEGRPGGPQGLRGEGRGGRRGAQGGGESAGDAAGAN